MALEKKSAVGLRVADGRTTLGSWNLEIMEHDILRIRSKFLMSDLRHMLTHVSGSDLKENGGDDETRTRDLFRDSVA
jgi:hypothetical protein